MSANAGRNTSLTWKGSALLGMRTKGIKMNGEPINVTSDENDGVQTLLYHTAEDSIAISLAGVMKDPVLKNDWFAGGSSRQGTLVHTDQHGAVISGTFHLVSFDEGDPYNDAITFQCEFRSAGAWAYTPGV